MFGDITTNSAEEFRDDLSERLGDFIETNIVKPNRQGKAYEFIKGFSINIMSPGSNLLNNEESLENLFNICEEFLNSYKRDKEEKGFGIIEKCLKEVLDLKEKTFFQTLLDEERHQISLNIASAESKSKIPETKKATNKEQRVLVPAQVQLQDIIARCEHFVKNSMDMSTPVMPKDDLVRYMLKMRGHNATFICESDFERHKHIQVNTQIEKSSAQYVDFLSQKIDDIIINSEFKRVPIILGQGNHYTPFDIDKEKKSCFVFDAAGDIRKYNLIEALKQTKMKLLIYDVIPRKFDYQIKINRTTRLQHDGYSCPLFAVDQSFYVSRCEDIHELLNDGSMSCSGKREKIDWLMIPHGSVVKNAQSTTFIACYCGLHPEQKEYLMEATNNNTPNYALEAIIEECQNALKKEGDSEHDDEHETPGLSP